MDVFEVEKALLPAHNSQQTAMFFDSDKINSAASSICNIVDFCLFICFIFFVDIKTLESDQWEQSDLDL